MFVNGFYKISSAEIAANQLPAFAELIPAAQLRRMSQIMKLGVFAALKAHQLAGKPVLDAIITATSKGCVTDTAKFLVSYNENAVSPTAFIQSTHNAIAGQIALILQSKAYNFTYTQAQKSFEAAFLDAQMLIAEGAANVLCGWFEENENGADCTAVFYLFSSQPADLSSKEIISIQNLS